MPINFEPIEEPKIDFESVDDQVATAYDLIKRFGKHIGNVPRDVGTSLAEMAATPEIGHGMWDVAPSPEKVKKFVDIRANIEKELPNVRESIPGYNIPPATGFGETAIDVTAGLTKAIGEFVALKKILPVGTPPAAVMEVQNLMNGGTPGSGVAMFYAMEVPAGAVGKAAAKFIQPATKAGKLGVAATQAVAGGAGMGTYTAAESLIDKGEVDWKEVWVNTGLGIALQSPAVIRAGLRFKNQVITNAIIKHPGVIGNPDLVDVIRKEGQAAPRPQENRLLTGSVIKRKVIASREVKRLTAGPKALPMAASELIDRKAKEIYDDLLDKASKGDKKAEQKLVNLTQNQNLPTLDELYTRVAEGDKSAADEIQLGMYASPEKTTQPITKESVSVPEKVQGQTQAEVNLNRDAALWGLRTEAAKELKLPQDKVKPLLITQARRSTETGFTMREPESVKGKVNAPGKVIPVESEIKKSKKLTTPGMKVEGEPIKGKSPLRPASPLATESTVTPEGRVQQVIQMSVPVEIANEAAQIIEHLDKASWFRRKVAPQLLRIFHGKQYGKFLSAFQAEQKKGTGSFKSTFKALGAMKGEEVLYKDFDPIKLPEKSLDKIADVSKKVFVDDAKGFQHINAVKGLDKLNKGQIPTDYELSLLEKIFGKTYMKSIRSKIVEKKPVSAGDLFKWIIQAAKLRFNYDVQTNRQTKTLRFTHPIVRARSIWANIRSYASEQFTTKQNEWLENNPRFSRDVDEGLWMQIGSRGEITNRLEYMSSGLTEKLQTLKGKYAGIVLRSIGNLSEKSERGAVTGINTALKMLWEQADRQAQILGLEGKARDAWLKTRGTVVNHTLKLIDARGLDRKTVALKNAANYVLFSPAMTVSRPLLLKDMFTAKGSRGFAIGATLSNLATIGAWSSIIAIIGAAYREKDPFSVPPIDSDENPLSSGWGGIRLPNSRIDISGGDASWYKLLMRIGVSSYLWANEKITGEYKTKVGGVKLPDVGEALKDYAVSRETAALGVLNSIMTGKDFFGNELPYHGLLELVATVTPGPLVDLVQAGMASGTWETAAVAAASAGGEGGSVYPIPASQKARQAEDALAHKYYSKEWDALTFKEQDKIHKDYKKEFAELEAKHTEEARERPADESKVRAEQRLSGKRIQDMLSSEDRELLKGSNFGIGRKFDDHYLSDEKYQRLMELTADEIQYRLKRIRPNYKSEAARREAIDKIITLAKKSAHIKLKQEDRKNDRTK